MVFLDEGLSMGFWAGGMGSGWPVCCGTGGRFGPGGELVAVLDPDDVSNSSITVVMLGSTSDKVPINSPD